LILVNIIVLSKVALIKATVAFCSTD